ncbi:MAG: hypothetical protein ACKN9S_14510 [Pirellula sp.]
MISRPLAVPYTRWAFKNDKLQKRLKWPTTYTVVHIQLSYTLNLRVTRDPRSTHFYAF